MNHNYHGSCKCGSVGLFIRFPNELSAYAAIACDCDYCTQRELTCISDVNGAIEVSTENPLIIESQGSNQAEFLCCSQCGDLVVVAYRFSAGYKGALNANLLNEKKELKKAVSASPKLLSPDEKLKLWRTTWSTVEFMIKA